MSDQLSASSEENRLPKSKTPNGAANDAANKKFKKVEKKVDGKENVADSTDRLTPSTSGDDEAAEEPDEVPSQGDSQAGDVAGPLTAKQRQREQHKFVMDMPFVYNKYPAETVTTVPRVSFAVDKEGLKGPETTAEYLDTADTLCIICHEENDENGESELLGCQGKMNGISKKIPCRSKYHLSCITMYNANSFQFQYSALPECQNKLLCPLHTCASCSIDKRRQSSYIGELTECALCLRAYHSSTCLPVGCVEVDVDVSISGNQIMFGMMVCPSHAAPSQRPPKSKPGKVTNVNGCHLCKQPGPYVKCSTCIRSFHPKCIDQKKLDGMAMDPERCDFCQCGEVLRENQPVIVLWEKREFWVAYTRGWEYFPKQQRSSNKKYLQVGQLVVDWLSPTNPLFSIVSTADVVPLLPQFLHNAKSAERPKWEKILKEFDVTKRFGNVLKPVNKTAQTSRFYAGMMPVRFADEYSLCSCKGNNRCSVGTSCENRASNRECPPECSMDGKVCHNRMITEKKVNPNMELRAADGKGYGVFAKEALKTGEYLGEYVGEIFDFEEKNRRQQIVKQVKDSQANFYMMEMPDGLIIDAARIGNITRYVNHSCEPNCRSAKWEIFHHIRKDGKAVYEHRAYLEVIRPIAKGEELTFDYQMEENELNAACVCGVGTCTGKMAGAVEDTKKSGDKKKDQKSNGTGSKPAPAVRKGKIEVKDKAASAAPTVKMEVIVKKEPFISASTEQQNKKIKSEERKTLALPKEESKKSLPALKPRSVSVMLPKSVKPSPAPSSKTMEDDVKKKPLFEAPVVLFSKRLRRPPMRLQDTDIDVPPVLKRSRVTESVSGSADSAVNNQPIPADAFDADFRSYMLNRAALLPGDPIKKRNVQMAIQADVFGVVDEMMSHYTATQTTYNF